MKEKSSKAVTVTTDNKKKNRSIQSDKKAII